MRTLIALTLLGLAPLTLSVAQAEETVQVPERGVIFHLSQGKKAPHHVIHPLVRAKKMAEKGIGVLVYLDIDAAPLVFDDAKPVRYADFDSTTLVKDILAAGGRVAVCAQCAKKFEKSEEELLDGVVVSNPDLLFSVGRQTLTFDY